MRRISPVLLTAALVLLVACASGANPPQMSTVAPPQTGTLLQQHDLPPEWTSTASPIPSETPTATPAPRSIRDEGATPTAIEFSTSEASPSPAPGPTAIPSPTLPPEAAWQTYTDPLGAFQLKLPPLWDAWAVPLECGVLHFFDSGGVYNLRLVLFTRCWEAEAGGRLLTFDETYNRFADQFQAVSRGQETYSGLQVERVHYRDVVGDFLLDLEGNGSLALWRRGELGFAFIDHRDQWQTNMVFQRILSTFEYMPEGAP